MLYFYGMSDINMYEHDIVVHESPSRPKWAEKIIQVAAKLAGNPHEPRKTRSQTSIVAFTSDSSLDEHYYMMVGSDP